jgi:hypothetical protein
VVAGKAESAVGKLEVMVGKGGGGGRMERLNGGGKLWKDGQGGGNTNTLPVDGSQQPYDSARGN